MANPRHVETVRKGAAAIASWRKRHPGRRLDLRGATLRRAKLEHADLSGADLSDARLEWADLRWAELAGANLSGAVLIRADLHKVDAREANLSGADLSMANLEDADLQGAVLRRAVFRHTRFLNTDLADTLGLAQTIHEGPSTIDGETFAKSGPMPDQFLARAGLPAYAMVYRVFVASPGDVRKAREEARRTIHLWNERNGEHEKVLLVPLMWENMTPELGSRAQEVVNRRLLAQAHLLVCIFWSRIGTSTGKAKSGTLEEIARFLRSRDADSRAMLFFSSEALPHDHDTKQWRELRKFKAQIRQAGIVGEYSSLPDLREKLLRGFTDKIAELRGGKAT
jgi:hypothetical protein